MVAMTSATLLAFGLGALTDHPVFVEGRQAPGGCSTPVTLDASTNIWTNYTLNANSYYGELVEAAASRMSGGAAEAARRVGDVGTFLWADNIANIARIEPTLKNIPCDEAYGLVVYNLPGRDCAAKASLGELPVGALDRYQQEFIDPIASIIKRYPNQAFALIIEPDSLPNLITNINLKSCQDSAEGYRQGIAYAFKTLNLPNVVMYMDAGHGGWLGWDDNITPAAEEFGRVYRAAGSPKQVRGVVTNVSGWNTWNQIPGEFANDPGGRWNKAQNEKLYLEALSPALQKVGFPSKALVDVGRSGKPGGRQIWGAWCNVIDAGFGPRSTSETGSPHADALVWVKPGGESDGTSDSSSARFDEFCGRPDAFRPSPEAGQWNQAYFEMLLKNANPPF